MKEEQEVWKPVVGWEDVYSVSSLGRVKSFHRNYKNSEYDGNLMKPWYDKKGYVYISMHKDHKRLDRKVHRLVAIAFIDNPKNKSQVNHINGIKDDNRLVNLEWMTNRENRNHYTSKVSTSKYCGVHAYNGVKNWIARIRFKGETIKLGYFDDEKEAGRSYVKFCVENNIDYDFGDAYLKEIEYKR